MVNIVVWLVLGTLIGLLGSTGGHHAERRQLYSGLGIIGALLGGLGFYRFDFTAALNSAARLDLTALLIAFIGAISLLTIVSVALHGSER
jgi:uncharacterized membrane protein YeaQ/YmgE (transglycosylase-associated protein family)